ncbi:hypothetical protein Q3V30_15530 [Erwinia pyri]|uniref:Uncharacterized protein n=1 Tax=Erwinia pyri TaxID=3062598 RepID=A0AA50DGR5_9GAMM|nr:hypothetical protein [Erwinia sp. DE2]WLS77869.1 hypothetical protein Q3V30_15530 [Erwinia sp. DE2]
MENEKEQAPLLPELPLKGIPQEILRLGKRLADTKYQIDMLGKTGWGELTANLHGLEASGEWDGPDDALTFFSKIFPFAMLPAETEPLGIFRVPTERVIGRSWRWWPDHLSATSETKLLEHLEGPHAAESTSWYFLPALGVLLAAQGQSRVNYCRQRHIPFITARVSNLNYPPADRFRLYHVTKGQTRQSWVVLNDRYLQPVLWPRITLPALTTYGVHSGSWPLTFPPTDRVFSELYNPLPAEDFVAPCIDLLAVNEAIKTEALAAKWAQKPVKMALSDMDITNIWPVSLTLSFFFILSLVIAGVTAGEGWAGCISLLVCGMAGSLLLFLASPVFLVSKRLRRDFQPEAPAEEAAEAQPPEVTAPAGG